MNDLKKVSKKFQVNFSKPRTSYPKPLYKNALLILLLFLIVSSFVLKNMDEREMARVEKIDTKEIYLFSEPLQPYKVVEDYTNSKNLISSCNLRNIVDSYLKKAQKDKVKFDALYMNGDDDIYLIKFIAGPEEE
ncbi:MAG TPA: hypothetical protein VD908_03275 [Cytophagales bacterium]|nr:hypothetical protein [Cytophagales bacterium]